MPIDFESIKTAAAGRILELAQLWVPGGRLEGQEYLMLNPKRQDQHYGSFKINVDSGQWADFAAGKSGGDVISFAHYVHESKNQGEAAQLVADALHLPAAAGRPDPPQAGRQGAQGAARKRETWIPIIPVPAGAPAPFKTHFKYGTPAARWEYKTKAGETIGYIYRFDIKDGKEIWPVTYCKSESGAQAWRWLSFPKPRPLYGLEFLADVHKAINIVIVEGEKTADAARQLFKNLALVMTWPGGTKSIKHVDFKPLKGRKVVIWPDNDQPGITAADNIGMDLKAIAAGVKIVRPPAQAVKGWDLADALAAGWSQPNLITYLKNNLRDPVATALPASAPAAGPLPTPPENTKAFNTDLYPFRCLGYDKDCFYYLPQGSQQVVRLRGEQHDEKHITAYLAPLDFWQDAWTVTKRRKNEAGEWEEYRSTVDWRAIKRFLIWNIQYKSGVYRGDNLRGPGIWRDNKRYVIHLGDRLLIDGRGSSMAGISSNFIYEKKKTREAEKYDPLNVESAIKLLQILDRFSWAKEINARLVGGWAIAGLMGGALPWRPHIWLNGPQSCGKSSVLKDVVRRALGDLVAIFIEGATTEAGLRQEANHCSFPILFDEAESADRRGQVRMEQIIELMRSSASPDGGRMLKGTPGGSALTFDVQSCFCLASISNNARLAADIMRIVNIEMTDPSGSEKWEIFRRDIVDTLNVEWAGRFRARVFKMLPVIRESMDSFIKAVRDHLDSQRFGDVYGVLLGASHCLVSDQAIDYDNALDFVKEADWTEQKAQKFFKDEIGCMIKILQRIVTVKSDRIQDRTLWELIQICHSGPEVPVVDQYLLKDTMQLIRKEANDAVRRYGVLYKVEDGRPWIIIANNNIYIEQWLKDTQYIPNWYKWLRRIKETVGDKVLAARPITPRVFVKGQPSARGVMIPYEIAALYMEETENQEKPDENTLPI